MNILTNQDFNAAIPHFRGVLFDNLQSSIKFKIVAADVKQVNEEKYLFGSITIGEGARLEFTVSYDKFYRVPVFSFRVYVDGKLEFDIIELDESLKKIANLVLNKLVDISIVEHHLLLQPWFQIHPCETLETLHTHISSLEQENASITYLSCWFGLYGLPAIFPQFSIRPIVYS